MNNFILAALTVFLYFTTVFIIAQIKDNYSLVDIAWGPGFVLIAWVMYFYRGITSSYIIPLAVSIWGLRLFYYISKRNLGKGEDFRYTDMRKKWKGNVALNAFLRVFMLQGLLQYMVALPIITNKFVLANRSLMYLGLFIFTAGLLFEAIADKQLKNFLSRDDREKRIMTEGVWKYSRHPNYFGEASLWWGIFIKALAYNAPIYSIIGPITITYLVRFVSGVPILEKRFAGDEEFEEYARKTSIFIPWLPKSD